MSEDSRRERPSNDPKCAGCWALVEGSSMRFYTVDGERFCESCVPDIGREMLFRLDVEAIVRAVWPERSC
jgi:hypothetical protein